MSDDRHANHCYSWMIDNGEDDFMTVEKWPLDAKDLGWHRIKSNMDDLDVGWYLVTPTWDEEDRKITLWVDGRRMRRGPWPIWLQLWIGKTWDRIRGIKRFCSKGA